MSINQIKPMEINNSEAKKLVANDSINNQWDAVLKNDTEIGSDFQMGRAI